MKKRTIELNGTKFVLGNKYRDKLLQVEGIAVASACYLTGCDQLKITFNDTTGRPVEHWIDVVQVEGVEVEDVPGGPAAVIPAKHP